MAHYAFLDENNVVTEVIVGRDETDGNWEVHYAAVRGLQADRCKRTSYNTTRNQHHNGGQPFRGNYAGVGYSYDPAHDVFLPPQPFASWVVDPATATWVAPVAKPSDDLPAGNTWRWSESGLRWEAMPIPTRRPRPVVPQTP